jgi:HSP20 family protein
MVRDGKKKEVRTMLPVRWDPLRELSTLRHEVDDIFRRAFGMTRGETAKGIFSPIMNAFVKGDSYCVEAEIPGVDKNDLEVSVDGNMLTIRGERKMSREEKEEDYIIRESDYGSFMRRLTMPEGVKTENVHASYDNGVLKITIPMEKKAIKGRKIEIEGPEKGGKQVH